MSNSANINARSLNPVRVAVNKRPHYVGVASLSIFRGNLALTKVCRGLISVHYSEFRGVRFSEFEMY